MSGDNDESRRRTGTGRGRRLTSWTNYDAMGQIDPHQCDAALVEDLINGFH